MHTGSFKLHNIQRYITSNKYKSFVLIKPFLCFMYEIDVVAYMCRIKKKNYVLLFYGYSD